MTGGAWGPSAPQVRGGHGQPDDHDPNFPAPHLPCPSCRVWRYHLIEHRPSPPGLYASWPDEASPHWRRECLSCGHVWLQPA